MLVFTIIILSEIFVFTIIISLRIFVFTIIISHRKNHVYNNEMLVFTIMKYGCLQ